jgi:hypothetical protein
LFFVFCILFFFFVFVFSSERPWRVEAQNTTVALDFTNLSVNRRYGIPWYFRFHDAQWILIVSSLWNDILDLTITRGVAHGHDTTGV